ncbi:UDP-glycosyltransferase UGT5-like [Aricia agestis]|uniref:UDP-glycosyltransferase UGT5-like n=1 Tax=Aricia agestis TaxID=91739 RepID=UPI001C20A67A|nr:UDP-glycosyltransferase UGT5-like [Aricia agestis]
MIFLCLLASLLQYVEPANILYVIPFTSISHYIMLRPVGLELARRGHNVTVITANKEENPPHNYREVMVDDKKIWDILGTERPNIFTMVDISAEDFHHHVLWRGGLAFTEMALNSSAVQDFLKEDNKFDLVVVEQFFEEAFYALAHKYNAPLALITTFGNCMRHNIITGNPLQLSTVIAEFLDVREPETFWGRFRNFYFVTYEYVMWKFWYLKKQEALITKYLPDIADTVPSLIELQKNVSVFLINGHSSYDTPVALLPNIIEVGGLHLSESTKSLPKDIKYFLDNSTDGVVYVNFGSNVRSAELPLEKKNAFLNVFRRLKQNVLWKWEDEKLDNKPDNVLIKHWLPQKEILAHPNIKMFISHGGLIGTQEAIFNGVPILGVPIYCDQYNNLLLAKVEGYGCIMSYHDIDEDNLYNKINEILKNDTYAKSAKEMSRRFKDRPLPPLDTAIFWLEYVIRNNGAEHLKNPARNMSWVTYSMWDVYTFVFLIIISTIILGVTVVKEIKSLLGSGVIKVKMH